MPTPAEILARLRSLDDTAPRITWYDLGPGPTTGERVELSARVLANWVAKAANALVDEFDLRPGDRVRLALPPHWRSLYWALACWTVGVEVVSGGGTGVGEVDLTVTDDLETAGEHDPAVLVTLAALARSAHGGPDAVFDEARELSGFGDVWAGAGPSATDPAWTDGERRRSYAELGAELTAFGSGARVHVRSGALADFLGVALSTFAAGGSVVLTRGGDDDALARIRRDERVEESDQRP